MKQPARSREQGQRLSREELSPSPGFGRMAEVGALATVASAMAIGSLQARDHQAPSPSEDGQPVMRGSDGGPTSDDTHGAVASSVGDREYVAPSQLVAAPGTSSHSDQGAQDAVLDPAALTVRIAEQIASSVSQVLDAATGGGASPQTLSRDIVEQAHDIAREIHNQFTAHEPLAVLADLVPRTLALDTIGSDIIHDVGETLTQSGVMDLLRGASAVADPEKILGGIVADLHGLQVPIDVAAIVSTPLQSVEAISETVLGGTVHGQNPLADLFYDDGGADNMGSAVQSAADATGDLATHLPKIGFLGQVQDVGEELGGLTHGHNALQML